MEALLYVVALVIGFVLMHFFSGDKTTTKKGGNLLGGARGEQSPQNGRIPDRFHTLDDVIEELRKNGLESSNLILGIDFTKSNEWTGKHSFGGRCLHDLSAGPNPYQQVIQIVGKTLEAFDDDKLIPCFGFGDQSTTNKSCFPFYQDGRHCQGFEEALYRYTEIVPHTTLSGPTNFGPVIRKATEIAKQDNEYHILVIIADGQVTDDKDTVRAIVDATTAPLSIVCVGVGDGPWDTMHHFDDNIPERKFDNFQFVEFNAVKRHNSKNMEPAFALAALMEVPDQFKIIRKLRLLESKGPSMTAAPTASSAPKDCSICLDREVEAVMVPCGHQCTCLQCGQQLSQCPICRQPVERVLKTYQS